MTSGWFDLHAHLPNRPEGAATLLRLMAELGIERAVVVPGGSVTPQALSERIAGAAEVDVPINNAAMLEPCARSGGKLIPFFFGNPHRSPAEYETGSSEYRGLKLGPAVHGVPLTDPRNLAWVRVAESKGHPVYLHCLSSVGFDVPDLVRLAGDFPKTRFVLGHAGVGNLDFRAVALIEGSANILFETSGGFSSVVKFALERLGARRVLFGTEYPLQDPAVEVVKALRLGLDSEALLRFTRRNAEDLLEPRHA